MRRDIRALTRCRWCSIFCVGFPGCLILRGFLQREAPDGRDGRPSAICRSETAEGGSGAFYGAAAAGAGRLLLQEIAGVGVEDGIDACRSAAARQEIRSCTPQKWAAWLTAFISFRKPSGRGLRNLRDTVDAQEINEAISLRESIEAFRQTASKYCVHDRRLFPIRRDLLIFGRSEAVSVFRQTYFADI